MKKLSLILFAIAFAFKTFSQDVPRFATSEEANAFIESKIESRLTPFLEEHDIDLSLFETYLIKVGFATPDSIGAGFVNFLNHLVVPINEDIRFDLLCGDFLEEVVEMIGRLNEFNFWDFYLLDYILDIMVKCDAMIEFRDSLYDSEMFHTSDDYNCVFLRQLKNTLFFDFHEIVGNPMRSRDIIDWLDTRDSIHSKEIWERSIYQPVYLYWLSRIPHLHRIMSGEAIFLPYFLDNGIRGNLIVRVDTPLAAEKTPIYITFVKTASGELEDVEFFDWETSIKYEDLSEKVREAFKNSYFRIGLFNGEKVSSIGRKVIWFREPNQPLFSPHSRIINY